MKSHAVVIAVAALAGCSDALTFSCADDSQCNRGGVKGQCIKPPGVCANPSANCPSGLVYDPSAGALAGQCVTFPDGGADLSGLDGQPIDMAGSDGPIDMAGDAAPVDMVPQTKTLDRYAGQLSSSGEIDGPALTMAKFNTPIGIASDGTNIYVSDFVGFTIRKITPSGAVTTIAGQAGVKGTTNANGTNALFWFPAGLAYDNGNLYVADVQNYTIRKIVLSSGDVTTFAGTAGTFGNDNALFNTPMGLACDTTAGLLYVADSGSHTIRKIVISTAAVSTFAGMPATPGSNDGTGLGAKFNGPSALAVDGSGNIYVADTVNAIIRLVTPSGSVTTIAGTAGMKGSGDGYGAAARFQAPDGIVSDAGGNLFVADQGNHTVRKIVASSWGVTSPIGSASVTSVQLGALPGGLGNPANLVLVPGAGLLIADSAAHSILVVPTLP